MKEGGRFCKNEMLKFLASQKSLQLVLSRSFSAAVAQGTQTPLHESLAGFEKYLIAHNADWLNTRFQNVKFETDIKPQLEFLKGLGFGRGHFTYLAANCPEALLKQSEGQRSNVYELAEYIQKQFKLERKAQVLPLLKYPDILKIGLPEFQKRLDFLASRLGFTQVRSVTKSKDREDSYRSRESKCRSPPKKKLASR